MSSLIHELLARLCPCLPLNNSPVLKINHASFRILRLLGEGGFSYVYLVELSDGNRYALKKIRCAYGSESIRNAMNEVHAYREFNSPYIVKSIDTSIVEEKDGLKSIYILLPYFANGTLQDLITSNVIKEGKIDESEAVRLFIGVCRGLQVMHRHKLSYADRSSQGNNSEIDMEMQRLTRFSDDGRNTLTNDVNSNGQTSRNKKRLVGSASGIDSELNSGEADILLADSDDEGGEDGGDENSNYDSETLPDNLMDSNTLHDIANALNDGTNKSTATAEAVESTEMGELVPYAHRDVKPGNVMMSADGTPVLCDLGSCARARLHVQTRQQALALQDLAAEHCTLPYRAPELLDVSTGAYIDERIDVWSLGCTLYALLYGSSPFERAEAESGASVSLAISSGRYTIPDDGDGYSEGVKDLIRFCLVVDPKERPTIEQVLSRALNLR